MEYLQKLPLGIQDFKKLREENFLYVDKTDLIHELITSHSAVFLSRPRRFGKSLLLSTINYYFQGKKELFRQLFIEKLEQQNNEPWAEYPVLYFDFNGQNYSIQGGLNDIIENHLKAWEEQYACKDIAATCAVRFENVIKAAYEKSGRRVVVLVDEYDKPLLETMISQPDAEEQNRDIFKGVFGVLKKMDAYLRFCMFTGVTKFSKVSIFSDLNQLTDISLTKKYNGICGISQKELERDFGSYIKRLADYNKISDEETLSKLKTMYDGHHFCTQGDDIYNPFSLFHAFDENDFGSYWFESGTPGFLVKKIKEINFNPQKFSDKSLFATKRILNDYNSENPDPVPLLYQSGYLTIKDYDEKYESYCLAYPNAEVKYGFVESLAPEYLYKTEAGPLDIRSFGLDIDKCDIESFMNRLKALFASLPYTSSNSSQDSVFEQNFQNVIYIIFTLLGKYTRTEVHSARGRADCIMETVNYIYIFEFKRDSTAAQAIAQINKQNYATPYSADHRKILKLGVNFSSKERNITEWSVE